MNLRTKRLDILDSLRGVAALIVVFHHFMVYFGPSISSIVSDRVLHLFFFISELNSIAVLFFFVLSGFAIALAAGNKDLTDAVERKKYLFRRFNRILPLYWLSIFLALTVGIACSLLRDPSYGFKNLLGNLFFLQTSKAATRYWVSPYGNNGPLWSLAYEMYFYLFLPVLILIQQKIKLPSWMWVLNLLIMSIICIYINKTVFFIPPLSFLAAFVIWYSGYISAQYYINGKKNDALFIIQFIVSLMLFILSSRIHSDSIIVIIKGLLIAAIFYIMFRFSIFQKNFFVQAKRLINLFFNRIGHGSYALYVLHYPILIFLTRFKATLFITTLILIVLITVCPFIEKTSQKLKLIKIQ